MLLLLTVARYKYTTMGSASYNATQLSYVFNVTKVPITSNATVSEGDLLGLAISGSDFAPYCHLESDNRGDSTYVLYQLGSGQNSWRGRQGKTSPVYQRVDKSVKFFVTYV